MSNEAAIAQKLSLDFWIVTSLCVSMDDTHDDREALAVRLIMEAGRLMEDVSPEFARALPDEAAMAARVELLDQIGSNLRALAAAVRALLSPSGSDLNGLS